MKKAAAICAIIFSLCSCKPFTTTVPATLPTKTPAKATKIPLTPIPAPTKIIEPTIGPYSCSSEPQQTKTYERVLQPGASAELIWRSQFRPWKVRAHPDGRILAASEGADAVYELKPDGDLGIAFQCYGWHIRTFAAANDGVLWVVNDDSYLYRITADGVINPMAKGFGFTLEPGPQGEVYGFNNGLVRVDPDGSVKTINAEIDSMKFAVSSAGEIVFMQDGNIIQVFEDGSLRTITSGYEPEAWPAFDPQGALYMTNWFYVDKVDLSTGTVTPIDWLENHNLSEAGAFATDGKLLLYHGNTHIFQVDLKTREESVFYEVKSNSWAMAPALDGEVYIAFGNSRENRETVLYRVIDKNNLEKVLSFPYHNERTLLFDGEGLGYISMADAHDGSGSAVIRFDLETGSQELYYKPGCGVNAMAQDPSSGAIWMYDCREIVSLNDQGGQTVLRGPDNIQNYSGLAITPDGEFYTIGFFKPADVNSGRPHYIYRHTPAEQGWQQMADLTQSDPAITLATLTICTDGRIYTVESLDGDQVGREHSTFNAVRRLEPDGSLTLLAFDLSIDGSAVGCDPLMGRILLTSSAGIFAFTPAK